MNIKISNLNDGIHEIAYTAGIDEFGLTEPFVGKCDLSLKLSKINYQIVLNTKAESNALLECDRCGETFSQQITADYQTVYLLGQEKKPGEDDLNIIYLPIETDNINISEDVKDFSILAVPMKNLCKEDCKGLCYKCGTNFNESSCKCTTSEIDDRWKPLLDLKNKLNN